jgi:hypothetical protein
VHVETNASFFPLRMASGHVYISDTQKSGRGIREAEKKDISSNQARGKKQWTILANSIVQRVYQYVLNSGKRSGLYSTTQHPGVRNPNKHRQNLHCSRAGAYTHTYVRAHAKRPRDKIDGASWRAGPSTHPSHPAKNPPRRVGTWR